MQRGVETAYTLIALFVAACAGFVVEISGDFHWHLALGAEMLDSHSLYTTDVHSYSLHGEPMLTPSWLAEVLFAGLYRLGGLWACFVFRSLLLTAAAWLLIRDAAKRGAGLVAGCALVTFVIAARFPGFYLRPETIGLVLLVVVLAALGAHERRARPRYLIACIALCAVWANVHGSVGIGLLAIGLYCAQRALTELWRRPRDRRVLVWAIATPPAAFLAACLNPDGIWVPLAVHVVKGEWLTSVGEWAPLSWRMVTPMLQVIAATTLVTTVAALVLAKRTAWWLLVLVAVLTGLALSFRRFVPYSLLAQVPLVAANLALLRGRVPPGRVRTVLARALPAAAVLWSLVAISTHDLGLRALRVGIDASRVSYPVRACHYLRDSNLPGPVFNEYNVGGYLMFCLGKQFPVFVDQRSWLLYDNEFWSHVLEASRSRKALKALLADYPAPWAVTQYSKLGAMIGTSSAWRVVYFDDKVVVFRAADAMDGLQAFRFLNPFRLSELPELSGADLEAAKVELERQEARCPDCMRTDLARAGVAIAAGDVRAVAAALKRLTERGETPALAYMSGRFAMMRGDRRGAVMFFRRFAALGGDRELAAELIQRAESGER